MLWLELSPTTQHNALNLNYTGSILQYIKCYIIIDFYKFELHIFKWEQFKYKLNTTWYDFFWVIFI